TATVVVATSLSDPGRESEQEHGESQDTSHVPHCAGSAAAPQWDLGPSQRERSGRRPWRSAQRTACRRSVTSICRKMLVRCVFTVFSLKARRGAIHMCG